MKRASLIEVMVETSQEAEEAVVELLGRVFCRPASVYTNEDTRESVASVFCENASEWSEEKQRELAAGLELIGKSGLAPVPGKVSSRRVRKEDWEESWKRHFRPIRIGSRLLVKPSWIKRRPRKGQAVVVLDPGLSFGTGNHPTTAFCLRSLVEHRREDRKQSFLDLGTGSGILAIAAVKLGYAPVRAMDFDPEAVRIARDNARRNKVLRKMQIEAADVTRLPLRSAVKYDLICANLISNLLIAEARRIVARSWPGGRLVLAGILQREFGEVQRVYETIGFTLVRAVTDGEWRSGLFEHGRFV